MNKAQRFTFQIPLLKAVEVEVERGGKKEKERIIEGKASSTDLDLHGDRMAPSAIETMAESIKKQQISLNAEHDKSWQSELGEVTELTVTDNYDLMMKAKLDNTSKANDLWHALTEKGKKLGLSIGGYVKDYTIEVDQEEGLWIRTYTNIELDHVAVTSSPANPTTWVDAIAKSLNTGHNDTITSKKKELALEDEEKELLLELAKAIREKGTINIIDKKEVMKDTPLETDVQKEESVGSETEASEESVTPENGGDVTPEEVIVEEQETAGEESSEATETTDDVKDEESEEETTEKSDEESTEEESADETAEEAASEEVADGENDEKEAEKEDESKDDVEKTDIDKSIEKSAEEKSVELFNFILKGDNELTKTLSTITNAVKEVTDAVIATNSRIDAMENQSSGRQVSEIGKGMGGVNSTSAPELSLTEALEVATKSLKPGQSAFAIKQRIRAEYRDKYGIVE